MDVKFVISILKVLCPYLKKMAAKTASPIDDYIVNIICSLVSTNDRENSS